MVNDINSAHSTQFVVLKGNLTNYTLLIIVNIVYVKRCINFAYVSKAYLFVKVRNCYLEPYNLDNTV